MIGKNIWQKETCENGINWVYVRCDTCGYKRCYLVDKLLSDYKRKDFTFVHCERCEFLARLKRETSYIIYASNEVFLK